MRWVITDSSVLIHLTKIGQLDLLRRLFGEIVITPSIWREVVERGDLRVGVSEVSQARTSGWIKVVAPTNDALLLLLKRELDDGESEAIALAVEKRADLVLLDEGEARRIADLYGLAKTGVIGILIRAKREGHIASLKGELLKLRTLGGFWIDESLYHIALAVCGEPDDEK
jgi:predicted nucleic acid-binding protein